MRFTNPYWSNRLRISTLQRWILVHSILYYEMDTSVVEDKVFDANARQLVQMQAEYPGEAEETQYWYVFFDFDGSTGFDLPYRLTKDDKEYLKHIASHVLELSKTQWEGGTRSGKSKSD